MKIKLSKAQWKVIGKKAGWIKEAEGAFRPVLRRPTLSPSLSTPFPSSNEESLSRPKLNSNPIPSAGETQQLIPKLEPKIPTINEEELEKSRLKGENSRNVVAYVKNYIAMKSLEKELEKIKINKSKETNPMKSFSLDLEIEYNKKQLDKIAGLVKNLREIIKVSLMDDGDWQLLRQYGVRI